MNADEMRAELYGIIRDELELPARLQGKRIVVGEGDEVIVILVTRGQVSRETAPDLTE